MRVCFYTLGCKVNLNETGALEQMFRGAGFTIVPEGEEADVFVVNSCTVTNFGDQKSRKWLRRAKRENPGAVTVLTGCYPQAFPEEAAQFMEADLVCGNGDRKAILDNVLKLLDGHERIVAVTPHQRGELFEELPVERFETHTRAFIKVEDGCNRQCAYCVIPRARGPVRSRAEDSILKELRQLAASGYREVVLSAISLPSYGLDTGTNLVELVEKCAQVEGIERIRLGSLDPDMLTPEFITRLAAVEKLCPQFHLSLQSGCTSTLRRMRRVYTAEQYAQVVDQIRAAYGERPVSFTTDCICGFPGETQARDERAGRGDPPGSTGRSCRHRGRGPAGNAPLRDAVHRLHPAVHPGGGLCPRPQERRDRSRQAGRVRWRARPCSTLLKKFVNSCASCTIC